MVLRSLQDYISVRVLTKKDSPGLFTNPNQIVRKRCKTAQSSSNKYLYNWFLKTLPKQSEAIIETVAQEIMRLYSPRHPKTRLMADRHGEHRLVLSKDLGEKAYCLEEYSSEERKKYLNNGTFSGLGEVMVLSLFLNEGDLKFGNIFVKNNQIIKIDGDLCFWNNRSNEITTRDLAHLPHILDYKAGNWLDIRYRDKRIPLPQPSNKMSEQDKSMTYKSLIFPEKFNPPGWSTEIHRTILEILLTPPALHRQVVYDSLLGVKDCGEIRRMLNSKLLSRQEQLRDAALKLPSFINYLSSQLAIYDSKAFINKISQHHTRGKRKLVVDLYRADIESKLKEIQREIQVQQRNDYYSYRLFQQPALQPHHQEDWVYKMTRFFLGGN